MSALELFAFDYFVNYEPYDITFLVFLLFAVLIYPFVSVSYTMSRSTYFLCVSAILLAVSTLSFVNVFFIDAIMSENLTTLLLIKAAAIIVITYFMLHISKARSNDCFGKPNYALLGFIPILILLLIFKPSLKPTLTTANSWKEGTTAIIIGILVLFFGNFVSTKIGDAVFLSSSIQVNNNQQEMSKKYLKYISQTQGVEAGLEFISEQYQEGMRVDAVTLVQNAKVTDDILTISYLVETEALESLAVGTKLQITEASCFAYEYVLALNGRISIRYFNINGKFLDEILVSSSSCTTTD